MEDLFGEKGACSGCWCMYWRIGRSYRGKDRSNKMAFKEIVRKGPPPDCSPLADRLQLDGANDRAWRLKRVDDSPVWSLSCFYIRVGYRRKGITSALIAGALRYAKQHGAAALEAYPLDADETPSSSSTGYDSTFARIGFTEVARRVPPRPILRHDLKGVR